MKLEIIVCTNMRVYKNAFQNMLAMAKANGTAVTITAPAGCGLYKAMLEAADTLGEKVVSVVKDSCYNEASAKEMAKSAFLFAESSVDGLSEIQAIWVE